jgi:hypothetical protein
MAGQAERPMSASQMRPSGALGANHPAVSDRRRRDLGLTVLTAVIPALIALGVTVALPHTSLVVVLAAIGAVLGIVVLMINSRLEVTIALLAFYLLMLDGPVKLLFPAHEETAALPNILIVAISAGALMRIVVRKERVPMPPLSAWVLGFVGVVALEAFNPHTQGILKILAGFREELEWVPFFFFGYVLMRSKRRLRQLFLIVGVAALANGLVSAYQTKLSPAGLAAWGPGYHQLIYPSHGSARIYTTSEGESRVRPPGLGSDEGFSGGVGQIALPFALALLATARSPRRRWTAMLLCIGALIAIITGLGRGQLLGGTIGVLSFGGLAVIAGRQVSQRALGAMLAVVLVAIPSIVLLTVVLRHETFSRYESLAGASKLSEAGGYKNGARALIVKELKANPFGVGLGTSGPTAGLGGKSSYVQQQYRAISDETQYNILANEVGAPGVLMWLALSLYMISLFVRGMRSTRDTDLALYLAGVFAPFIGLFAGGFSGALNSSAAAGPYFWFAIGVAAYWVVGPGRSVRSKAGAAGASTLGVGSPIAAPV